MRTILCVVSIIGIFIGIIGTWYYTAEKTIVDRCGGSAGAEGGITVCQNIYGTNPLLYLFIGILALCTIGLILSLIKRSPKVNH